MKCFSPFCFATVLGMLFYASTVSAQDDTNLTLPKTDTKAAGSPKVDIKGRCITDEKKPVEGARVTVFRMIQRGPITRIPGRGPQQVFEKVGEAKTTKDGHFVIKQVPEPKAEHRSKHIYVKPYYAIFATAKDTALADGTVDKRSIQSVELVLDTKPMSIKGTVLLPDGKPAVDVPVSDMFGIVGARMTKTDKAGRFELGGFPRPETQKFPRHKYVIRVGLRESFYVALGSSTTLKLKKPIIRIAGNTIAPGSDLEKALKKLATNPDVQLTDASPEDTPPKPFTKPDTAPTKKDKSVTKPTLPNDPNLGGIKPIEKPKKVEMKLEVFRLRTLAVKHVAEILKALLPTVKIGVDEESNSLLVAADEKTLKSIELLIKKLDGKPKKLDPKNLTPPGGIPTNPKTKTEEFSDSQPPTKTKELSIEDLHGRFRVLDEEAKMIASKLKTIKTRPYPASKAEIERLQAKLKHTVFTAFEARQQLQRAEVTKLRQKLLKIERQIALRDQVRDEIIDRRVDDLLNPEFRWEPSSAASGKGNDKKTASATPKKSTPRTIHVKGTILDVDGEQIKISIGADDGLRPKTRMMVTRLQTRVYVGEVEVVQVTPDQSVARIMIKNIPFRVGDKVFTRIRAPNTQSALDINMGKSVVQTWPIQSVVQIGGTPDETLAKAVGPQIDAQLHFTEPEKASVRFRLDDKQTVQLIIPGRIACKTGSKLSFTIDSIPQSPGARLSASIQMAPTTNATRSYLRHMAVSVSVTNEDVDQVLAGNFVTRVVYLPEAKNAELAIAGVETIVSTRLDPGLDPVTEAKRRGDALLVLRLGNRADALKDDSDSRDVIR